MRVEWNVYIVVANVAISVCVSLSRTRRSQYTSKRPTTNLMLAIDQCFEYNANCVTTVAAVCHLIVGASVKLSADERDVQLAYADRLTFNVTNYYRAGNKMSTIPNEPAMDYTRLCIIHWWISQQLIRRWQYYGLIWMFSEKFSSRNMLNDSSKVLFISPTGKPLGDAWLRGDMSSVCMYTCLWWWSSSFT